VDRDSNDQHRLALQWCVPALVFPAAWYDCLKVGKKPTEWAGPMTTSSPDELLRRPEDLRRGTFLELFFDLAFVVALFQLSHVLIRRLDWSVAFQTLVLLLAVWWVWFGTAWLTDQLDPQRPGVQLVVIATLLGSLVLAGTLGEAFGRRGLVFAGAYVGIQVGRNLLLALVLRRYGLQRIALRTLFWTGVSAPAWILGALTHGSARGALWTLAIALHYTAFALGYPTPWLGRTLSSQFSIVAEHLAERYRQFFIIALGELFLVTGLAFSSTDKIDQSAAFVVSIATTALFWRIYIYRAGELLSAAIAAVPQPARLAALASYAHLIMVAGTVATAVGAELVIAHPFGHTEPAWVAVILGGPALFLTGRAGFEYTVFHRVSTDRLVGLFLLAALTPPMLLVPPVIATTAAAAILAGIAISDAIRARRYPAEPPSPSGGQS
jgi:low temperature requirement protein LtrA